MLSIAALFAAAGLWRTPPVAHGAATSTFSNVAAIQIADADGGVGNGYTYPSTVNVSGMTGIVTDVNVTINGLTHTWPDDLGLLLVGPGGQNIVLQSDVGGTVAVSNVTYTFDDAAASGIHNGGPITAGSYRPTSVNGDSIHFPASVGAPAPPYREPAPVAASTLATVFAGSDPNGTWKLYAVDTFAGGTGAINSGWTLQITTNATAAAPTLQLSAGAYTVGEFEPDVKRIGQNVVVGAASWESRLESNKVGYFDEFVSRSAFSTTYPASLTAAQFVDALNANAGGALSTMERNQLVSELAAGTKTRAQVLRAVAEDADFASAQFNRAFVLMEYFGYLRRNPNDTPDADFTGYNFWLGKLNSFGGDYVNAELVKAFITSLEYRQRFGQQ